MCACACGYKVASANHLCDSHRTTRSVGGIGLVLVCVRAVGTAFIRLRSSEHRVRRGRRVSFSLSLETYFCVVEYIHAH